MKKVKLTRGKYALVDDEDFVRVSQHKWHCSGWGYPVRRRGDGKQFLHRFIMGEPEQIVDHINGNKLDCRKSNLRLANYSLNGANRPVQRNNKCGLKGVRKGQNGRWRAGVKYMGVNIYLGEHPTPQEAALEYNHVAKQLWEDFALLSEAA